MLNPQIISENIVYLRQRMNLTQQELAARANVTHQAVSKWENGSSIPDLQTLMTLSRLFGVTLDALLTEVLSERKGPETIEAAAPVEAESAPQAQSAEEDAAPQEEEPPREPEREKPEIDLRALVALAPFTPRDKLCSLVLAQADSLTLESLVPLAPFLGRQAMDEIAARMDWTDVTPHRLMALAPFLSSEALKEAISRMNPESVTSTQLTALAPFLGQNALGSLIQKVGQLSMKTLASLAPFLSRETIGEQLKGIQKDRPAGEEKREPISSDRIALRLAEKGDFDEIGELMPFLHRETLSQVVDMALEAEDLDFLMKDFDRLPGDARRKIALRMAENGDFDEISPFFDRMDGETRAKIVAMALDEDEADFLREHFPTLPGEVRQSVALRMAENGDFDEIEPFFEQLDEETRAKIVDMALDEDELDFLQRVNALRPAARADEEADAASAMAAARQGDFTALPGLFDRLTDDEKDEAVRLAIVYDATDFLVDLAEDLPRESLETLCFALARLGETARLEPFEKHLTPQALARLRRIIEERA